MVNAIEGELLFASGMRLSLADAAEVYVLPPAFATPGAAVTMPLRRDELTGYDCVWVEPISMDAALRDELRGWYHIKMRFVENDHKVHAILSPYKTISVDTPKDRVEVEEILKKKGFAHE